MSDQEVRSLERLNAADPSDLDVSQRLLAAYIRTGTLIRGDAVELAALGDTGAIALTGKTPDLSSRTKRFYIRCAWMCLREVVKRLDPGAFRMHAVSVGGSTQYYSSVETLQKSYVDAFKAIIECDQTVEIFLNKLSSMKEILEKTERLKWKFESLRRFFSVSTDITETQNPSLARCEHEALYWVMSGYIDLCGAFEETTKKYTDQAINSAAIAMDSFRGLLYRQVLAAPPRGHRIPADYFNEHAKELLSETRREIIAQWLPNYTPLLK